MSLTLGPLPIALVGLAALIYGWSLYAKARRAATWPVVAGTITKAESQEVDGRHGPAFRTVVTYSYRVGGEEWESSRIGVGDGLYTSSIGGGGSAYQIGDAVEVHYDPEIPSHAVLIVASVGSARAVIGVGVLILVAAGAMALGVWR